MKIFIGLTKVGFYLIGEVVTETVNEVQVQNVVRLFEVPTEGGRVSLQFHPDPYFLDDEVAMVSRSNFIISKVSENTADRTRRIITDYTDFLAQIRMRKSGLITSLNPEHKQKILQEQFV